MLRTYIRGDMTLYQRGRTYQNRYFCYQIDKKYNPRVFSKALLFLTKKGQWIDAMAYCHNRNDSYFNRPHEIVKILKEQGLWHQHILDNLVEGGK